MFTLLNIIVAGIAYLLMAAGGGALLASNYPATPDFAWQVGPLFWLGSIVLFVWIIVSLVPGIAVTVRRLHDLNLTGWIYLGIVILMFIPIVSFLALIAFIILMAWPGNRGPNKYGPNPKAVGEVDVII